MFARTLLVALTLALATPGLADFKSGMAAFERGDFETALREWRPLAEQGVPEAQFNLGLLYEHAKGVERDLATAHAWYLRAAEGGYARAQFHVAELFESGEGVRRDPIHAHYWFARAAAQKYEGAKKRKHRVAQTMTPEQIAYAELLMRQYKRGDATDD